MESDAIKNLVLVLVPMILSLSVHEYAHALVARRLGDRTAERAGRLTLNPMAHVDPFGSLLLPALLVLSGGGFLFGWARPVPFDPKGFREGVSPRMGIMATAAAGPASNLLMAVCSALVLNVVMGGVSAAEPVTVLLAQMVFINVILALFNMIPVPPLDGSKVLHMLFPGPVGRLYGNLQRNPLMGTAVFLGVILLAGRIVGPPSQMLVQALLQ